MRYEGKPFEQRPVEVNGKRITYGDLGRGIGSLDTTNEGGNAMSNVVTYTEALPISEEWAEEHEGQTIRVEFAVSLDGLLNMGGVEGLNDTLDEVTGVYLTEVGYRIADRVDDYHVTIEAVGTIELL